MAAGAGGSVACDDNDIAQFAETMDKARAVKGKPSVIIANTVPGKGVSYMENVPIWHYRAPNADEYKIAVQEVEGCSG